VDERGTLRRSTNILGPNDSPANWEDNWSPQTETCLSQYALNVNQTVLSADVVTDNRFTDDELILQGVRSAACVPLRSHGKPLGTLEFYRSQPRPFASDDEPFLERIGRQMAAMLRSLQDEATLRSQSGSVESRRTASRDLRSSPRHQYPYRQMIAPIIQCRLPTMGEFTPVECRDLSGSGLSIFLSSPPLFHELVVSLGVPPHQKYCRAEVVHVQQVAKDGDMAYLLGCRFIERVQIADENLGQPRR